MGWDTVGWSVAGRVSRHNSPDDEIDDELWEDFLKRAKELRDEPKYERLGLI